MPEEQQSALSVAVDSREHERRDTPLVHRVDTLRLRALLVQPLARSNAISVGWLCCASPCSKEYWSASAWSRRREVCSVRSCRTRSVFPARAAERTASRPAFHCPYFFTGGDGAGALDDNNFGAAELG